MRNRLPALVALGALVLLAAVVARGSSAVPLGESKPLFGWLRLPEFWADEVREAPPRPAEDSDFYGGWAAVVGWIVLLLPVVALAVLIVLAVLVGMGRRRVERPTPVVRAEEETGFATDPAGAFVRAAHAARQVLDEHREGPPGDAVIAAWLELERVAAHQGSGKLAHQTPTEFTDEFTREHADIHAAVTELRTLYHRARFGRPGEVGAEQAEAAGRALDQITASMVIR